MGYWNSTCGVTNLPITENQRAVMIPLVMNGHERMAGGGMFEANSLANPVGLHIRGAYDTYGTLSFDKESFAEEAFFSWIEECAKRELILNEGEPLVTPSYRGHFYRSLERGELSYRVADKMSALGFMLVREDIFDGLVAAAGKDTLSGYSDNKQKWVQKPMPRSELLRTLLTAPEDELRAARAEQERNPLPEHMYRLCLMYGLYTSAQRYVSDDAPFASKYLLEATSDERIFKTINEFLLFNYAFGMMRKTWHVPNGRTQTELEDTAHLYQVVATTMQTAIAEYEAHR